MTDPKIVFSPHYNIGLWGFETFLHPFDTRRASRVWRMLRTRLGNSVYQQLQQPQRPISQSELLLVHSPEYLETLRSPKVIAQAVEVQWLASWPRWLLEWSLRTPMRWITAGTILAAEIALHSGAAIHLAGGFHHAKPGRGEGFCLFADAAIAVASLRKSGMLSEEDRVLYIDLDAHQGNGVCHCFREDRRVFIFDMFCETIYPWFDSEAKHRVDSPHPLPEQCEDELYLSKLCQHFPGFVTSLARQAKLAIYNAGMDVLSGDPVGRMSISAEGILARDLFVYKTLREQQIPVVLLPSGGYTKQSASVFATSVEAILRE